MPATHEFEDHTSEVAVLVRATTAAELFEEAARALAELMLGEEALAEAQTVGLRPPGVDVAGDDVGAGAITPTITVHVRARDQPALMVEWLNELIFRAEVDKAVFTRIEVIAVSDDGPSAEQKLTARVAGIVEPTIKTAVKAATFHDLAVWRDDQGYGARVILDV